VKVQAQITINSQVKIKNKHVAALSEVYEARIAKVLSVARTTNTDIFRPPKKSSSYLKPVVVLLDSRGALLDSKVFAQSIKQQIIEDRRPMLFCVGGPDGFTTDECNRADQLLSFGRMTIANQLVQLMLVEQLYRATTIISGHPYHTGH